MPSLYDARGNRYIVATPDEVRTVAAMPAGANDAAARFSAWTRDAIDAFCRDRNATASQSKRYLSDGLLVGPFFEADGIGLLIVNTSATLAERSGNGLTIFAQFLTDKGIVERDRPFSIHIYHGNAAQPPLVARIVPSILQEKQGFWVDMGVPKFGPEAVGAKEHSYNMLEMNGVQAACVSGLQAIDPSWTRSIFVSVGNPHCVTFLDGAPLLPAMAELESPGCSKTLQAIAFDAEAGDPRGTGSVCRRGINLQWAAVTGTDTVEARIFERGEGTTNSSGSSATAVASAARHLGIILSKTISVVMPGGTAPIMFESNGDQPETAMLFGEACQKAL